MKIIAALLAILFFILSLLFIVAAFHPFALKEGLTTGRIIIASLLFLAGFVMIYLTRLKPSVQRVEVRQTFDAPGDLNLQQLKCKQCGGELNIKEMKLISGSALIECPYCNATYQLEEEPKW